MVETVQATEELQNPETIAHFTPLRGLQGRIALSQESFLNPDTTLSKELTSEDIPDFENRSYSPIELASFGERSEYWQQKAQEDANLKNFDEKKKNWISAVARVTSQEGNKAKISDLSELFKTLNVEITDEGLKEDQANSVYERYFGDSQKGGVKLFIKDIISSCKTAAGTTDKALLQSKLSSVEWFAGMFGQTSAEIISQLVDTEIEVETNKDGFINALNEKQNGEMRVNILSSEEKRLLHFIRRFETEEIQVGVDLTREEIAEKLAKQKFEKDWEPLEEEQGTQEKWKLDDIKDKLQAYLRDPDIDSILLKAGTGTGKSTRIGRYLLELLQGQNEVAYITEPRRKITEGVAGYVRNEMKKEEKNENVISFRHGEDGNVTSESKIIYTIDKSLLNRLIKYPDLIDPRKKWECNYVVVDEVHTRPDILIALLRRAQQLRRDKGLPPLKVIYTSATPDVDLFEEKLTGIRVIDVEKIGKHVVLPVFDSTGPFKEGIDPRTPEQIQDEMPDRAAKKVNEIMHRQNGHGDILIFMPGVSVIGETIKKVEAELEGQGISLDDVVILPYHRNLDARQRRTYLDHPKGDRKTYIWVATNIISAGQTLPYLTDVVLSGLSKHEEVDPVTGSKTIKLDREYVDELLQMQGRVGRKRDGYAHYLFSEAEYNREEREKRPPAIQNADLTSDILQLLSTVPNPIDIRGNELKFISKPRAEFVAMSFAKLRKLKLIDEHDKITAKGREVATIPLDINIATFLVEAAHSTEHDLKRRAIILAALASQEGSLFIKKYSDKKNEGENIREQAQFNAEYDNFRKRFRDVSGSDWLALENVWNKYLPPTSDGIEQWISTYQYNEKETDENKKRENMTQVDAARLEFERNNPLINLDVLLSAAKTEIELERRVESITPTEDTTLDQALEKGFADQILYHLQGEKYVFTNINGTQTQVTIDNSSLLYLFNTIRPPKLISKIIVKTDRRNQRPYYATLSHPV